MSEEEIIVLQDICGARECPIFGQPTEPVRSIISMRTPSAINTTFNFVSSLLRFAIYIGTFVFVITIVISLILVIIKFIRKQKGVQSSLIIIFICIVGIILSILEVTVISYISALN